MRTALLDPLADPRWARLVAEAPQASPFHHPSWLGLLRRHYRYPVAAACVLDGQRAVAGLPLALVASRLTGRRLVAVPFSDACPPLRLDDAAPEAMRSLAGAIERERRARGVRLEVRARFAEAGEPVDRFLEHVVDLRDGLAEVERRYAPQVRRNIRKAGRAGVTFERRTDLPALDLFYGLHLRTRRRLGVPTQPKRFIRGLAGLFARGLGFVALARHEGRPAAAAVFLIAGRSVTYKYGASDERSLPARPNNLLFAEAIRWACAAGLHRLDLGRTDLGQEGLRAFKRSWGAVESPLAYTYAGGPAPAAGHSGLDRAVSALVQRAPVAVGRGVGELLYRHVG